VDIDKLIAIDVHTHVETSVRNPQPPSVFQEAARKYFKHDNTQPNVHELAAYYRERRIGCVVFPVDGKHARGIEPVSNEEVAELAAEHSDIMMPFASVDPARGPAGVKEARRLIEHFGVKGFKFHPQFQEFFANCSPRAIPAWVRACRAGAAYA
jgi:predicted TIM-barrel fold metal-dependent hydrolase